MKLSVAAKYDLCMVKYRRVYPDNEGKGKGVSPFKSNIEYVEKFNCDGNKTCKLGLNEFVDLSHEEFVQLRTGYINPAEPDSSVAVSFKYESLSRPDVPLSVDWRMHGAVTPRKASRTLALAGHYLQWQIWKELPKSEQDAEESQARQKTCTRLLSEDVILTTQTGMLPVPGLLVANSAPQQRKLSNQGRVHATSFNWHSCHLAGL
ncbi:hypothetical protein C1H46_037378 [Malus baccata]|uniref:Cathepsin propeptide inhibitor domain-containing protein n=1 Tax=Malus baccata TaxID=106549 RepID=A0A540KSV9_MALBA|nr:hypothetical protein C1H46_037378 [Malus baccata]